MASLTIALPTPEVATDITAATTATSAGPGAEIVLSSVERSGNRWELFFSKW